MTRRRQRIVAVVIVVLAVLTTVLLAGAFVPDPSDSSVGTAQGDGEFLPDMGDTQAFEFPVNLPAILMDIYLIFIVYFVVVGIPILFRELTKMELLALILGAGIFARALLWALSQTDPPNPTGSMDTSDMTGAVGNSTAVNPGMAGDVPVAVVGVVVVLLGIVAVFVLSSGRGEDPTTKASDDDETAVHLETVGDAAGRAADRLEGGVDSMNAVYQAWKEMTDVLDVPQPETTTPGEFADAAIRAGMAPEDVSDLTDAFEAVRYGDQPVTSTRVERAETALRHIEATYSSTTSGETGGGAAADSLSEDET